MSDSVTLWTVAYQAPPSMGFSRQEYWSGFLFPSPGGLPYPGIKPKSPALQADALTSEPTMYPACRQFLLPKSLLTNPDILERILWEWVW